MRLLRRRTSGVPDGCDCRLCRPEPQPDPRDRKTIRDVRKYGVHIVLVSDAYPCSCPDHEEHAAAEPTDEPDFAYTVGLWHQRRHPELLMSGLSSREVVHGVLDGLADLVREGETLRPGDVREDVLRGYPVTFEELTPEAVDRTVTWSAWFHRRDVPALQVVWPDRDGLFGWQQGAHPSVDERQPPRWRVPGPRQEALAPQPPWPFPVPFDHLAFTCPHLAEGTSAALYVQRDADPHRGEDWTVSCGADHAGMTGFVLLHLSHLVSSSPGLRQVADLPLDHWAERADARAPWRRYRSEPEDS